MENKEQKKRPTLCVDLLNTFSKKELAGFTDFLTCHYFNTDKLVIQLFKALQKYVIQQHFFDDTLRCRVYEFVFKKQPTEKAKLSQAQKTQLNRKLSLLLRLAEEFIAINALRENKYSDIDYLYPDLLKRKQHSLVKRHFNKIKKIFNDTVRKNLEYYEKWAKYNELYLQYLDNIQRIEREHNINDFIIAIDLNYLLVRLSVYQNVLALSKYTTLNIDAKMHKPITELLNLKPYCDNLLLKAKRIGINMLTEMNQVNFEKLIDFIKIENKNISKEDLLNLYKDANNYCTVQIRKGFLEFYKTTFDLYIEMHQQNLLLHNNFLHSNIFTNIVTAACRAKQFVWAEKLSKHYKPHLVKSIREGVYNYNLGLVAFFQQDYNKAHSYFLTIGKTNSILDFNLRLYILKCLFENSNNLNYQFLQHIKYTQDFFKQQKKIPINLKKGLINFLTILLEIYNYKYCKRKISITEIEQKLSAMEYVSFRAWLSEKMSALE